MIPSLRLTITTPLAVLADDPVVRSLRAEDTSGSFGILPGHIDLVTVLPASVLRWDNGEKTVHYCALRGGVLTVSGGNFVSIACRQGTLGDDLSRLAAEVEAMQEAEKDEERRARTQQMRMHARAVRQLMSYLQPQDTSGNQWN